MRRKLEIVRSLIHRPKDPFGHTMSLAEEVLLVGVLDVGFIGAGVWRSGRQEWRLRRQRRA